MILLEIVRDFVAAFERFKAPYLIVGALAYNRYGIPRSTRDVDFVAAAESEIIDRVLRSLPPQYTVDAQSRMELFTATMRWVVRHERTGLKIELFVLGSDAHHQQEFRRRKKVTVEQGGLEVWMATAEDLIIQKLRWARNKDLDDVRNILAVQGAKLDRNYLETWTEAHGTTEKLREIESSLPELK